jgi:D-sedoheptulose 7-phosphate isomerase
MVAVLQIRNILQPSLSTDFKLNAPPLAAIALTTDTSILTSIGNDYDYNDIFAKQIKAIGKKYDIAWGISTSGNSPNVVNALDVARKMELTTLGMTGQGGGKTAEYSDILFAVQSKITARIQETHITMGHILCDLVDRILFP